MDGRGLLIDIDGVLTVSWEPIPGAVAALRRLRESSIPVAFLTNTTSLSRDAVTETLSDAGFEVSADEILTAPKMTAAYLRHHYPTARCLVVGEGDVTADLGDIRLTTDGEPPEVIVLGGAGPVYDYASLNRVFQLALSGTRVVAMHRNLFWSTQDGFQLDTGAFVTAIERATGIEVTTVGKPSPPAFEAGLEVLGIGSSDAIMVGDDLDADVRGAQAVGIRGVLVRTGKFRPDQLGGGDPQPDAVLDSFADLPDLLGLG